MKPIHVLPRIDQFQYAFGASGYERSLSGARDAALEDMKVAARELGADGIVGIDFDYEVLGETNGMMMVSVSGTAVKMG